MNPYGPPTKARIQFLTLSVIALIWLQQSIPMPNAHKAISADWLANVPENMLGRLQPASGNPFALQKSAPLPFQAINQKISKQVSTNKQNFFCEYTTLCADSLAYGQAQEAGQNQFFHSYQNLSVRRKALLRAGKEKTVRDLLNALKGKTVEERIRNVVDEFAYGDYITPKTIFILTGVPENYADEEREDVSKQREVINSIHKIVRSEEGFEVLFLQDEDIATTIPIYSGEGDKETFRSEFDLDISCNSRFLVNQSKNGVKVDIEGVRVGKGIFRFSLPTLTIVEDWGRLLGLKFYVAR